MRFTNKSNLATKIHKYKAFTLAEVLITLGIIGVIAAITIPNLITNYQKQQYANSLKKAYTQMNQVLQQMAIDNGTPGSIVDYFPNNSTSTAGAKIASYYKVVKNCGTTASDECFAKFNSYYDGSANNTGYWDTEVRAYYKFVTTDGLSISVGSFGNNCTLNAGFSETPNSPVYKSTCGWTYIDINGTKKPNYFGKDIFTFYITSNKTPLLYPRSGFYHSSSDTGTTQEGGNEWWNRNNLNLCGTGSKNGSYCTGRLMEKGWVMDY